MSVLERLAVPLAPLSLFPFHHTYDNMLNFPQHSEDTEMTPVEWDGGEVGASVRSIAVEEADAADEVGEPSVEEKATIKACRLEILRRVGNGVRKYENRRYKYNTNDR